MGYMTTVVLLNDHFHRYQERPVDLARAITDRMHDPVEARRMSVGGVQVFQTGHADWPRLYFTQANQGLDLSYGGAELIGFATGTKSQRDFVDDAIRRARAMLDNCERAIQAAREAEED